MKKTAFTLMLNGMKFLPEQVERVPKYFDKWYIIEGPVNPVHCTSWCKDIPPQYINHMNMSSDGTYEYLNKLDNDKIEIIRSPIINNKHRYWNGKVEMCNSFMNLLDNGFLMEIDMDEFWSPKILNSLFEHAEKYYNRGLDVDYKFKCNFFVGENLIVVGENCYGDMSYEWNRAWVINQKTKWKTHEPPELSRRPTTIVEKAETLSNSWGFRHDAYKYEEQLKFKEDYYGYKGAVEGWKKLQQETNFPVPLRNYFPWVKDNAMVMKV